MKQGQSVNINRCNHFIIPKRKVPKCFLSLNHRLIKVLLSSVAPVNRGHFLKNVLDLYFINHLWYSDCSYVPLETPTALCRLQDHRTMNTMRLHTPLLWRELHSMSYYLCVTSLLHNMSKHSHKHVNTIKQVQNAYIYSEITVVHYCGCCTNS